ncbi:MAG: hypothetical protein SynsKO_31900 [Synoicihabitans sp.]
MLDMLLPSRFQLELDVPQTLIFYDNESWSTEEQNAVIEFLQTKPATGSLGASSENIPLRVQLEPFLNRELKRRLSSPKSDPGFFRNLMLTDADVIFVFALASNKKVGPKESYLTPAYVRTLLGSRVPALPGWLKSGFMDVYGKMDFRRNTIRTKPTRSFLTSEEFAGLKVSLPFIFAEGRPAIADARAWAIQSELFVCWGIDPLNERAPAFWHFVDRACSEPVTEALFEVCFGLDFGEAELQIDTYAASSRGVRWNTPKESTQHASIDLQDALPVEIARIKGEWERLEARFVRKNRSEFESQYVNLARRTLMKAIDRGERDPRLLASLGLLELDAGNEALAIPLLEEAAQLGVVRPRAYYELARLRYEFLDGRSTRFDRKYPEAQSDYMLKMLLAASRQSPPLLPVYELMEHVSDNSLESPTPEVVSALAQGAQYFPKRATTAKLLRPPFVEPIESPRIDGPVTLDLFR